MYSYDPIGGYFEMEIGNCSSNFHSKAIALNTGRNSLELILKNININRIYIPYYICDVILEPIKKFDLDYRFYFLDNKFYPLVDSIKDNEALLYVNYFGIFTRNVKKLSEQYNNLIIDNTQAFFSEHIEGTYSFYSPRKFFGVPDGGFAYINKCIALDIETDKSYERFSHLIKRVDEGPEEGYRDFKENDEKLKNLPIRKMSKLTKKLLKNVDFEKVRKIRNENFAYLHNNLEKNNELRDIIAGENVNGPMVYPYLQKDNVNLKTFLIKNKVFVATYWPNVSKWIDDENSFELYLYNNLIPLPIDQRYNKNDMKIVLELIKNGQSN
jgi:hypothetical protein